MTSKLIQRNIPPERENRNDRFRVKYNDKNDFDKLEVRITRLQTGEQKSFIFESDELPATDSIYFTTSVINNKLHVSWKDFSPSDRTRGYITTNNTKEDVAINKNVNVKKPNSKIAFPPIADSNSRILLLGTMPGERSLSLQQYYGHAGNHFWKIMYSLFDQPFTKDYEERKKLLLDNGIALWDVLEYCEGVGSLDSNIINEKANDFNTFYNNHPAVKHVFFTSKQAAEYYDAYVKRKSHLNYYLLPSPSRMNTWKTFDEKLHEWKLILKYL
jgi:TDG/mug DNA glycosylase family protein